MKKLLLIGACAIYATAMAQTVNPIVGNSLVDSYSWDYSPSFMIDQFDSNKSKMWWCGNDGAGHDVVKYMERPSSGGSFTAPQAVLSAPNDLSTSIGNDDLLAKNSLSSGGSTPNKRYSWEGRFLCDPTVVRGSFHVALPTGPGGQAIDTRTIPAFASKGPFTYALYYTTNFPGTENVGGKGNTIGVAFSHDGKQWWRHPKPIISDCLTVNPTTNNYNLNNSLCPTGDGSPGNQGKYGVGQAVAFSVDGLATIRFVYFKDTAQGSDFLVATSSNGYTFSNFGRMNNSGLVWRTAPPFRIHVRAVAPANRNGANSFYMVTSCGASTGTMANSQQLEYGERLCIYKRPFSSDWLSLLDTNSTPWQLVGETNVDPTPPSTPPSYPVKLTAFPVQVEPGFKTDAFGWVQGAASSPISIMFGCSNKSHNQFTDLTDYFSSWNICWGDLLNH